MKLTSPAFKNNGIIPEKYTCAGNSVNPALSIENIPGGTKSLVLLVESFGPGERGHIHWMVFNISPVSCIEENSIPGIQGVNSFFGKLNYTGPCSWLDVSRYLFKIYGLDRMLNLKEGAHREELEDAIRGHILGKAELIGIYPERIKAAGRKKSI